MCTIHLVVIITGREAISTMAMCERHHVSNAVIFSFFFLMHQKEEKTHDGGPYFVKLLWTDS